MSKWTPGPWRVGKIGAVVSDNPAPGIGGSDDVKYYGGHLICESVNKPNARLISLAPEMAEALRCIVAGYDEPEAGSIAPDIAEARALLAKLEAE